MDADPSEAGGSSGAQARGDVEPVALITGAGSGIGRATAVRLAADGYRLVLVGRQAALLEETAERAGKARSIVRPADLARAAEVQGVVDAAVEEFGRLDVLVNNAGQALQRPIAESTPEFLEEIYQVNALAPAIAIARAWPVFLRQRSGCIINLSTMGTVDPFAGFFGYAAAKAAVNVMAMSCAKEGAAHGIRAFAIAPGAVETPMLRRLFPESVLPREQCLSPEAVAEVIAACIAGVRDAENGRTIFLARGE